MLAEGIEETARGRLLGLAHGVKLVVPHQSRHAEIFQISNVVYYSFSKLLMLFYDSMLKDITSMSEKNMDLHVGYDFCSFEIFWFGKFFGFWNRYL